MLLLECRLEECSQFFRGWGLIHWAPTQQKEYASSRTNTVHKNQVSATGGQFIFPLKTFYILMKAVRCANEHWLYVHKSLVWEYIKDIGD